MPVEVYGSIAGGKDYFISGRMDIEYSRAGRIGIYIYCHTGLKHVRLKFIHTGNIIRQTLGPRGISPYLAEGQIKDSSIVSIGYLR